MKKRFNCILTIAVMLVLIATLSVSLREPRRCPLCDFIKSHAPCLVNVNTGEVEEMALYTPHETLVGEISDTQTDSTFSFVDIAGARGTRLSSPFIMELDVPVISAPVIKKHFCRDCRKILSGCSGYVIADLYIPDDPVVYNLIDGLRVELRCYSIVADSNDLGDNYKLIIEGVKK